MKKYLILMVALLTTSAAYADATNPSVYDKTYGEWSAKWAQLTTYHFKSDIIATPIFLKTS
jgi:hypothetical protein